jgi:site-specific DNA-methyltransferase (adenine-specific)
MLLKGDCRQQLATLPDNSIHAIITDPPYELGFMGKTWDSTGIAYNLEVWTQCLRVLKPGGHLLAFGGSRTYHRLACAIEDAGFEIRDQIMWVYGSGFPKSLDVSKAIDKAAGAKREVVGSRPLTGNGKTMKSGFHQPDGSGAGETIKQDIFEFTAPATDAAKQWDGWGTALKPAHEPIVLARKPLNGTVANNVLTHGVGALNIDDCRVGSEGGTSRGNRPSTHLSPSGAFTTGHDIEKLDAGRWPANFIHDGSDEVLQLFPDSTSKSGGKSGTNANPMSWTENNKERERGGHTDSGSAARFFYCAKASRTERNTGLDALETQRRSTDYGSLPKRQCNICGSRSNRNGRWPDCPHDDWSWVEQLEQGHKGGNATNFHPTVKPLALIHYLIKLVTPPGGTILDPFLGSGTTAVAATQLGHPWIGCELTEDYWPIIEARIAHATPLT